MWTGTCETNSGCFRTLGSPNLGVSTRPGMTKIAEKLNRATAISPIFALHPGNQISVDKTPELANAAVPHWKALAHGGATGWSRAWIINFCPPPGWEQAYVNTLETLKQSTLDNLFPTTPVSDRRQHRGNGRHSGNAVAKPQRRNSPVARPA